MLYCRNHWGIIKISLGINSKKKGTGMKTLMHQIFRIINSYSNSGKVSKTKAVVRFTTPRDIAALIELEHAIWDENQAASADDMTQRMYRYPDFCAAVFCPIAGKVLASIFARPAHAEILKNAADWNECANGDSNQKQSSNALFGISLTSRDAEAAKAVFEFIWPVALKYGLKEWYLGSPMPGLKAWKAKNPTGDIEQYAREKHVGLPRDRQLRYYSQRGFPTLEAVKENYFPHEESLNYGALLSGKIPLSELNFLWRYLPLALMHRFSKLYFVVL